MIQCLASGQISDDCTFDLCLSMLSELYLSLLLDYNDYNDNPTA